jgi:hypothetical protein
MQEFRASQMLNLRVPNGPLPIEHYLRQPHRLVQAITDPRRVDQLEEGLYRLSLLPLQFLGITIQPTTDLRVWVLTDGTLCLEAVDCQVYGPAYLDYVNQSFSMGLTGRLTPQPQDPYTALVGQADLQVQLDLPTPLTLMPSPMVQTAGGRLLGGILATIKHRLERQLVEDYQAWADQQSGGLSPADHRRPRGQVVS